MNSERGRRSAAAAVSVVVGLFVAACGGSETQASSDPGGASVGDAFTGEFETISGETVDLATFAGTDVVLWFWAPW